MQHLFSVKPKDTAVCINAKWCARVWKCLLKIARSRVLAKDYMDRRGTLLLMGSLPKNIRYLDFDITFEFRIQFFSKFENLKRPQLRVQSVVSLLTLLPRWCRDGNLGDSPHTRWHQHTCSAARGAGCSLACTDSGSCPACWRTAAHTCYRPSNTRPNLKQT